MVLIIVSYVFCKIQNAYVVELTDKSSYGTVINERRLTKGETVALSPDDVVKIGSSFFFIFKQECLLVAHTLLDPETKKNLQRQLELLGGQIDPVVSLKTTFL